MISKAYIVDDDFGFQFTIKKFIEITDFSEETIILSNGKEAINSLVKDLSRGNFPEVIFLDINMPVMDGWKFLEEFAKLESEEKNKIIIYIMSSSNDENDYKKANSNTFVTEYLQKPITDSILYRLKDQIGIKNI